MSLSILLLISLMVSERPSASANSRSNTQRRPDSEWIVPEYENSPGRNPQPSAGGQLISGGFAFDSPIRDEGGYARIWASCHVRNSGLAHTTKQRHRRTISLS